MISCAGAGGGDLLPDACGAPLEHDSGVPAETSEIDAVPDTTRRTPSERCRLALTGSKADRTHFSKIGDSLTASWVNLTRLAVPPLNLGPYGALQPTVDLFKTSLTRQSLAAAGGWLTGQMVAALPAELEVWNPAIVLIAGGVNNLSRTGFGPNAYLTALADLRQMAELCLTEGRFPVLMTSTEYPLMPEAVAKLNAGIIGLGEELSVPVIDVHAALEGYVDHGCASPTDVHPAPYLDPASKTQQPAWFTDEALSPTNPSPYTAGANRRNLMQLQVLDEIARECLR